MFRSPYDNIGFNPTQNQSEYGTPRTSGYGMIARMTPPMAGVDYFPSYPYRGSMNNMGAQGYGSTPPDNLYARTHLYRGIAPVTLQPLINKPAPYRRVRF
jgi:hypothetical protein